MRKNKQKIILTQIKKISNKMSAENGIKTFEKSEDLKEIEEEYNSCLTLKNNGNMRSPSLKYAYYNLNLKRLFMKKIKIIQINIDKIQKSILNNIVTFS